MAYEPTVWKTGDVVTADKLNKMEQGIADNSSAGGGIVLHVVTDETSGLDRLDKTFGEIKEALLAGKSVVVLDGYNVKPIILYDNIEASAGGTIYVLKVNTSAEPHFVNFDEYSVDDYSEYPATLPK